MFMRKVKNWLRFPITNCIESMAFIFAIIVVVLLWAFCLWLSTTYLPNWEARGQFGDLFGAVNALFSGLAFSGIIYAIVLQRKELELQRNELKLQRKEMEGSREALQAQLEVQITLIEASGLQGKVEAIKTRGELQRYGLQKEADSIDRVSDEIISKAKVLRLKYVK